MLDKAYLAKEYFFLIKVLWRGRFKSIFWTNRLSRYCKKGGTRTQFFLTVHSLFESKPARFTAPQSAIQTKSGLKDFTAGVG